MKTQDRNPTFYVFGLKSFQGAIMLLQREALYERILAAR